jgi:hypothetical protein
MASMPISDAARKATASSLMLLTVVLVMVSFVVAWRCALRLCAPESRTRAWTVSAGVGC